jgi:hypothetical protein
VAGAYSPKPSIPPGCVAGPDWSIVPWVSSICATGSSGSSMHHHLDTSSSFLEVVGSTSENDQHFCAACGGVKDGGDRWLTSDVTPTNDGSKPYPIPYQCRDAVIDDLNVLIKCWCRSPGNWSRPPPRVSPVQNTGMEERDCWRAGEQGEGHAGVWVKEKHSPHTRNPQAFAANIRLQPA